MRDVIYATSFWRHQAITWSKFDLSSKMFCVIHLTAISQELFMNLIRNMLSEITLLTLLPLLPEANELKRPYQLAVYDKAGIYGMDK